MNLKHGECDLLCVEVIVIDGRARVATTLGKHHPEVVVSNPRGRENGGVCRNS